MHGVNNRLFWLRVGPEAEAFCPYFFTIVILTGYADKYQQETNKFKLEPHAGRGDHNSLPMERIPITF